jgi:hypothetical protein
MVKAALTSVASKKVATTTSLDRRKMSEPCADIGVSLPRTHKDSIMMLLLAEWGILYHANEPTARDKEAKLSA